MSLGLIRKFIVRNEVKLSHSHSVGILITILKECQIASQNGEADQKKRIVMKKTAIPTHIKNNCLKQICQLITYLFALVITKTCSA